MAGLGLRWCQQHPDVPLILVSNSRGNFWRCEHESGCLYTEPASSLQQKAVAVNTHTFTGQKRRRQGRGR